MRVLVTGASGFIGMALVPELVAAGHEVVGLCRAPEKAPALADAGAEVLMGSLEDLEGLTAAAGQADAVVHLAFNHDFTRYMASCQEDRAAIAALGAGLAGSGGVLLVTSGVAMARGDPGRPATEDMAAAPATMVPRAASEEAAEALLADGVRASVMRLPQVHDTRRQGLVSPYIQLARGRGELSYVGEGASRWPAAHISDVARLYRLALEAGEAGARWHAVAEEGVSMREIAEALGRRLALPVTSIAAERAAEAYGPLAMFALVDAPASSALTRRRLGWTPTGPTLIEDLERLDLETA